MQKLNPEGQCKLPLWRAVLVLAGILLILFLVAGILLWLAFKMRLILITYWCLLVARQFALNQGLFCLSPPAARTLVGARSWEGTQPQQVTPSDPRGIPYHMVSCSVHKLEGKLAGGASALGLAGHGPVGGEHCAPLDLYILLFSVLFFFPFCFYSIKLPLSQTTNFFFYFPFLFPIPHKGVKSEWVAVWFRYLLG